MQLRLLKIAVVQIVTFFLLSIVAFLAYATIANSSAKSKAEAVCNSVVIGSGIDVAMKALEKIETETQLRSLTPEFLSVGFSGALLDRWYCNFRISAGKVVETEVRYLD